MVATASRLSTRRLRRLLSLILLPAVLLSLFAPAAPVAQAQENPSPPPPRYQAQVLEGPQGAFFRAIDLNNRGQVIGTFAARPNDIPELWEAGRFTRLPMLGGELEPFYPLPTMLNDAGHVVVRDNRGPHIWVGGSSYVSPTRPEPYYWDPAYLSAATLNNQGVLFAPLIDYRTFPNRGTAIFWNSGAFGFLPAPSNTDAVITNDLNDANHAVGTYVLNVGNGSTAAGFRYANSTLQTLTAPNSSFALPAAINSQGQVVGAAYSTQGMDRPVIWQADGEVSDLSIGTAIGGRAYDINSNGDIIGELHGVGPVLWRGGTHYRLVDLLPAELQLNLSQAVAINNAGQILVEGAQVGKPARFYLLTPAVGAELSDLTLQRQDRESAEWVDLPDPANIADGAPVRAIATIRNPGSETVSATIAFRDKLTGKGFPECVRVIQVPPTPANQPLHERCEIDTSELAWADGDPNTIGTRFDVEVELTPTGQAAQKLVEPLTVRPRPVIFVPGIGGNYAKNPGAEGDLFWLLNRGVAPGLLEIDPLIRSYDGILRTLANSGYTPGRDLFIANYDWRLMPGPTDRVYDGVITGLTPAGISDTSYQYGVDYLGDTLRVAAEVWESAYQIPLDHVDVIAHSTGGLVTRTYIQSTAYGGEYTTSKKLPRVKNFISVGVPHRGASKAWNPLHDNWGIDSSFRVVLSKLVNRAFQKVDAGAGQVRIPGPDYTITLLDARKPDGTPDPVNFIRKYVPTIGALMATYPFLDRGAGQFQDANSGNLANTLVLDLNNGADVTPGRDPNVFLSRTNLTAIGATSERTPTYVRQGLGPAQLVLAPFTDFLPANASAGEVYFEDQFMDAGGDGTVPTLSSVGQFVGDPRARVLTYQKGVNTLAKVGHTDLTDNPEIQADILRTLGAPVKPEHLVALGRDDVENITSIILDPVQGFVVDGQGRRLGWSEAGGPVSEIPNSFWSGGGDGFGLIFGPVAGTLRLELRGMDGPYYAQVTRLTAEGVQGGVTLEGPRLARNETVSAPALLPSQPYTPEVRAGGPYTVAEGASVRVAATGEAGLSYAWDLNNDGTFETMGQQVSFSAAGLDGPASRTVTVRGTLPTGQSATSAATVTVENVAPTATLSAPATATVGQPFTLALTGASDPGNDPLQFAFDCGTGYGPLGAASSVSCTPTAAGTLTVRASVADDDGGVNTYSATVTVNAAPGGQPDVALCYASGAQSWQDFAQGRRKNDTAVPANRSNPALALDLPQRNDTVNFVSLGFGGALTLRFANPLVNDGTSKADLRIWETSFGDRNRSWSRYPEAARIEVSLDGTSWTEIGRTTDKDQAYDLILPRAQFVRLTDISDPRRFGPSDDGFDLDAIEALTGCVRP